MTYQETRSDHFSIDLGDVEIAEVEILDQEGSRGTPEFAASTADCGTCNAGSCSCTVENPDG